MHRFQRTLPCDSPFHPQRPRLISPETDLKKSSKQALDILYHLQQKTRSRTPSSFYHLFSCNTIRHTFSKMYHSSRPNKVSEKSFYCQYRDFHSCLVYVSWESAQETCVREIRHQQSCSSQSRSELTFQRVCRT